ncbi:MAG: hypothetical protein WBC33_05910, partial [Conexibacter sp.]
RRMVYALEDAGGVVTALRVPGKVASHAAGQAALGRLAYGGRPWKVGERSTPSEAADAFPGPRFGRRRRTG